MKRMIQMFLQIFKNHKLKLLITILLTMVFFFLLFPFGDLSDVVTSRISSATGNQLFIQFDDMNLNLLSGLGLRLENVRIEANQIPPLEAQEITIVPWLSGLLTSKKGVDLATVGLFQGESELKYREGEKLKSGLHQQMINVAVRGLSLPALSDYLRVANFLNINLSGLLDFDSQFAVDPVFDQQPSGSLNVQIRNFSIPGQTMQVPLNGINMPISIPELALGQTHCKVKIEQGQIELQEIKFGDGKSSLSGTINGHLELRLSQRNRGISQELGPYNVKVDLHLSKEFYEANRSAGIDAALGILGLDQFKSTNAQGGINLAFRAKGSRSGQMPSFSEAN